MTANTLKPDWESSRSLAPDDTEPAPRILVADDEPVIRRLNCNMLTTAGHQVDAVADGAAAWDLLEHRSYDLLITDHSMPGLTGLELLKKLRNEGLTLPVIMATGTLPIDEFSLHLWLQPVVALLKPYGVAEFLNAVKVVRQAANGGCGDITLEPCQHSQTVAPGLRL